jgi:hypothetical protein
MASFSITPKLAHITAIKCLLKQLVLVVATYDLHLCRKFRVIGSCATSGEFRAGGSFFEKNRAGEKWPGPGSGNPEYQLSMPIP